MLAISSHSSQRPVARIALLVPVLLVTLAVGFAYSKGVTGKLFYDDLSFLAPLETIDSREDAWEFVTSGQGGPLGRPIALLSFLPHADDWPANSQEARWVNVGIHLANGAFVFLLGWMLLQLRNPRDAWRSYWIALSAAALWIAMPLLVSTSLITVQRWTGFATFWGLMGLLVFVAGYFLQAQRPRLALAVQSSGLGLFTLLALYTKESGALFPIYALVIDAVLLAHLQAPRYVRWLRRGTLLVGLLALLYYLSPLYRDWFAFSSFRGWSSFDRLLTEGQILWQYLYMAFLPQPTAFGPFHDNVTLAEGWLIPILSWGAFLALTIAAFLLRKRSPWPLFALLWFFTGHLIESTVIQLELMFEHRNYLAVYGFCLALAALVWQAKGIWTRLAPALLTLYILLMGATLYATTSIWGQPLEAAENWAQRHPDSPRAVMHLSRAYYEALGNPSYSLKALDRYADQCDGCTDLHLQAMLYACITEGPESIQQRFEKVLHSAEIARRSTSLIDNLYPLHGVIENNQCNPLTFQDAHQLTQTLLNNPNYQHKSYTTHILFHAANFAKEQGDFDMAFSYLSRAESLMPEIMPILLMQVHFLMDAQRPQEALEAIERRRDVVHKNAYMTDQALDELARMVREGKTPSMEKDTQPDETHRPDPLL